MLDSDGTAILQSYNRRQRTLSSDGTINLQQLTKDTYLKWYSTLTTGVKHTYYRWYSKLTTGDKGHLHQMAQQIYNRWQRTLTSNDTANLQQVTNTLTSDDNGHLPISSQMYAYSTLLSPAPYLEPGSLSFGRNKFHRPRDFANDYTKNIKKLLVTFGFHFTANYQLIH
jgi:hypothetical protein